MIRVQKILHCLNFFGRETPVADKKQHKTQNESDNFHVLTFVVRLSSLRFKMSPRFNTWLTTDNVTLCLFFFAVHICRPVVRCGSRGVHWLNKNVIDGWWMMVTLQANQDRQPLSTPNDHDHLALCRSARVRWVSGSPLLGWNLRSPWFCLIVREQLSATIMGHSTDTEGRQWQRRRWRFIMRELGWGCAVVSINSSR